MRTYTNVNRDNLNSIMEFDHVIRVHADGTVTDAAEYAPELCDGALPADSPWSLMTGYTGQYGYRGPIMHSSEFIGGRMADDILSTPGLYVALVSYVTTPDADCYRCTAGEPGPCDSHDINGWAVAYIHSDTVPVTYREGDREVTVSVEDLDLDRPMTDAERAEHDRYHVHKRPDCQACEDADRD